ncbi:MAG: hypothetical protein ABH824_02930 [Nanoarchaeota archaeon]|nr:hypothetical protein [Nanoarchaeota archaeon]MBU1632070.1 hypothetical protein [Nanoarchaeota archaeon]MBU1875704.1 hypothetical protein [Nanoarchaeota archaeon]
MDLFRKRKFVLFLITIVFFSLTAVSVFASSAIDILFETTTLENISQNTFNLGEKFYVNVYIDDDYLSIKGNPALTYINFSTSNNYIIFKNVSENGDFYSYPVIMTTINNSKCSTCGFVFMKESEDKIGTGSKTLLFKTLVQGKLIGTSGFYASDAKFTNGPNYHPYNPPKSTSITITSCTLTTCVQERKECGIINDGCGEAEYCGICSEGKSCVNGTCEYVTTSNSQKDKDQIDKFSQAPFKDKTLLKTLLDIIADSNKITTEKLISIVNALKEYFNI